MYLLSVIIKMTYLLYKTSELIAFFLYYYIIIYRGELQERTRVPHAEHVLHLTETTRCARCTALLVLLCIVDHILGSPIIAITQPGY